jgi:transcriptional regulator with XRE-family HTH domain
LPRGLSERYYVFVQKMKRVIIDTKPDILYNMIQRNLTYLSIPLPRKFIRRDPIYRVRMADLSRPQEGFMPGNRSGGTGGESVGARIRAARHEKKYTQSQLAGTDFSISYISAIERGQIQPSLRALEIIAQRLGLPSSYFFQNTPVSAQDWAAGAPALSGNHRQIIDVSVQFDYTILEVKILLQQKQPQKAIALLNKLHAHTHDARVQMRVAIQLGQAHLEAGQLHECEVALVEAEKLATRLNDRYARLRIRYRLGLVYAAQRQFEYAVEAHRQCLDMLSELQSHDPFWRFDIYDQLGLHYTQLKQYEDASSMFQQAVILAQELEDTDQAQRAFGALSQQLAQENYSYRSLLYAYKFAQEYEQRGSTAFIAELVLHLGPTVLEKEANYDPGALETMAAQYPDQPLLQAAILVILAEWQRNHEQLAEAAQTAQRASALALLSGESLIAAEARFMRGRVAYEQGRFDEGKEMCAAAIAMLQRLGLQRELAEHAEAYAEDLERHGKAAAAFRYMKLAFETRQRLGM